MIKKYIKLKQDLTDASKARGARQLFRLEVLIDVLFALMIFKLFTFMPNPEIDGFGREELYSVLSESYLNYTVILIGLLLVIAVPNYMEARENATISTCITNQRVICTGATIYMMAESQSPTGL